jgi:hypothetical protein
MFETIAPSKKRPIFWGAVMEKINWLCIGKSFLTRQEQQSFLAFTARQFVPGKN